jgi:chloride channel protein, CIC family
MTGAASIWALSLAVAAIARELLVVFKRLLESPAAGDLWWSVVPAAGAIVALLVVIRARTSPATADAFVYGVQHDSLTARGLVARFVALLCGVGLGVPLGYEGPMVYFGGAVGGTIAPRLPAGLTAGRRTATMACATAAVAVVIGAPIAAAFFASEVIRRGWPRGRDHLALATGAAAAWLVLRSFGDPGGIVGTAPAAAIGAATMGAAVIGVTCGAAGRVFALLVIGAKHLHWTLSRRIVMVAMALLVVVPLGRVTSGAWIFVGNGQRLVTWAHDGAVLGVALAVVVFAGLVVVMVAGGVVGGLFLPLLSIGGAIGLVLTRSWLAGLSPTVAVGVGACAMLAAGYGTPLAALALAASMLGTGSAGAAAVIAIVVASSMSRDASVSTYQW